MKFVFCEREDDLAVLKGLAGSIGLNDLRIEPFLGKNNFRCIAEKSERKNFSSKSKIRVWMASHVDYEFYVGKAAAEGYWPWESPAFNSMKEFLRQM